MTPLPRGTRIYSVDDDNVDMHDSRSKFTTKAAALACAREHAKERYEDETVEVAVDVVATLPRKRLYHALLTGFGWSAGNEVVASFRGKMKRETDR